MAPFLHQQSIDLLLTHGVIPGFLAYVESLCFRGREFQQFLAGQVIIDNYLCLLKTLCCFYSSKGRITRSGPNQIYPSLLYVQSLITLFWLRYLVQKGLRIY